MGRVIALFGATGRTGRRVLERALARGYSVRVLARQPEALREPGEDVTVVAGDALDAVAVEDTIAGASVVISVFGHVKGSPPDLQTRGTQHIVDAMRSTGAKRLITLSGGGLRDPRDQPKVTDRVMQTLLKMAAGQVLRDAEGHLEVLKESGLDWTVVRAPRLTTRPGTGQYRLGPVDGNSGMQISRDDLADAVLGQVDDTRWVRGMPFVSA